MNKYTDLYFVLENCIIVSVGHLPHRTPIDRAVTSHNDRQNYRNCRNWNGSRN